MAKNTSSEKKKDYSVTKKNYEKRFEKLSVRYSIGDSSEIKKIDKMVALLGFKSRTSYIKQASLNSHDELLLKSGIMKSLTFEVRKIGVNLNQIAYQLNSRKVEFNEKELLTIINKLKELLLKITQ